MHSIIKQQATPKKSPRPHTFVTKVCGLGDFLPEAAKRLLAFIAPIALPAIQTRITKIIAARPCLDHNKCTATSSPTSFFALTLETIEPQNEMSLFNSLAQLESFNAQHYITSLKNLPGPNLLLQKMKK